MGKKNNNKNKNIIYEAIDFNNIKEIMLHSKEKYGENIAFRIKHKEKGETSYEDISYDKLIENVYALGTALYDLGFKKKRVAIIGKNRYEWVLSHLANQFGGIISVPLDKDLQFEELENSLTRSKADLIIFDEKKEEDIKKIKQNKKTKLKEFVCMSDIKGYKSIKDLISLGEELIKNGKEDFLNYKIDENEMSLLLFTSGTTSMSKAVMLTQRNVASVIYALNCVEDARETDTNIAFLPFHHIFGSSCIVWTLSRGVRNVFPDGLKYIKQNFNEYEVSIFVGVPILIEAIYKTVMKEIEKQGKKKIINIALKISNFLRIFGIDIRRKLFKPIIDALGGHLRMIVSGGAPADKKIAKGFNDLGIRTVQGYGLTETAPVIAAEDENHIKYGSVGIPTINDTLEIVNKDENGIGEIRVKGPNVMLGYYEMEEETKEVLKDGWFYTGDLGYFDKQGYLFITGRNKNMIVLKNGKKIFPEELELMLTRIDEISESFVFGLPDEEDENDIKLSVKAVINRDFIKDKYKDKKLSDEEIKTIIWNKIKEINKTFPKYKHIKNLILTDEELIKTSTKKVKRQEEMKLILKDLKKD